MRMSVPMNFGVERLPQFGEHHRLTWCTACRMDRFSELRAFQSLYGEQFPNCGTKSGTHGCNVTGAANQMVGDDLGAWVEN